jgi:hypothetical protein
MKLEDLQTLSETEISDRALPLDQLWWVRGADGEAHGPYDTPTLRSFRTQAPAACAGLETTTLAADSWAPMMETQALAARRPPQLMSATALKTPERHFVLGHGQPHGPYSAEEVRALLHEGHAAASDFVSIDECANWQRIFELRHLHLTTHSAETLPKGVRLPPADEDEPPPFNTVVDALTSLAHLCHQHSGTVTKADWEAPSMEVTSAPRRWPKYVVPFAGAVAACGLAAVLLWRTPSTEQQVATDEIELEMPTVAAGTPSWITAPASATTSSVRRRPASLGRHSPPPPSPTVMRDAPAELMRYQETHDSYQEAPEQAQPLDVEPYADGQIAEGPQAAPQREPANDDSAAETPEDDGYRLLPPGKGGAVVEEVGDF